VSDNSQSLQDISNALRDSRREQAQATVTEPPAPPVKTGGRGKTAAAPVVPTTAETGDAAK